LRLDGHWPLHHELPDAVDCLNLPRLLPPFSPVHLTGGSRDVTS
jgi:hypothetical protein